MLEPICHLTYYLYSQESLGVATQTLVLLPATPQESRPISLLTSQGRHLLDHRILQLPFLHFLLTISFCNTLYLELIYGNYCFRILQHSLTFTETCTGVRSHYWLIWASGIMVLSCLVTLKVSENTVIRCVCCSPERIPAI